MSLYSCDHLSQQVKKQCPFCYYIPERHRGFYRSQMNQLGVWDEVMKEMKCQCHLVDESPMATHSLPFHLDMDWNGNQSYPINASEYCPCVIQGRLRDECCSGCTWNGDNFRIYGERFPGSKVKKLSAMQQRDKNVQHRNNTERD